MCHTVRVGEPFCLMVIFFIMENQNEIWKSVKGYEGIYEISNLGNLKSLGNSFSRKEKLIKKVSNSDGYYKVLLHKKGFRKNFFVHRIVAVTFINNIKNNNEINHINGIKTDNRVENLEWCTHKENSIHARDYLNRFYNNNNRNKNLNN